MISYEALLQHGEAAGGALVIKNGFSLVTEERISSGCELVEALSAFTGDKAPLISFSLTAEGESEPFYLSHSYAIGKASEYTRQSWRIPPRFLHDAPRQTILSSFSFPVPCFIFR